MRKLFVPLALVLLCSSAFAADDPKPKQMSAEEMASMQAMMKAMTPGENHKALDGMVGTFDAKVTMWMQPGAPPVTSTGKCVNSWVLGNRYIEQKMTGNFMGMPFEGIGYTGYDNVKKQYWGTWIDNMGTGVMVSTGSMTDAGKSWKFTGTMADPMSGKDTTSETRISVADHDHHTMEMWGPAPDGKMVKMMEIAYSRSK
jgi:hypothetical protein